MRPPQKEPPLLAPAELSEISAGEPWVALMADAIVKRLADVMKEVMSEQHAHLIEKINDAHLIEKINHAPNGASSKPLDHFARRKSIRRPNLNSSSSEISLCTLDESVHKHTSSKSTPQKCVGSMCVRALRDHLDQDMLYHTVRDPTFLSHPHSKRGSCTSRKSAEIIAEVATPSDQIYPATFVSRLRRTLEWDAEDSTKNLDGVRHDRELELMEDMKGICSVAWTPTDSNAPCDSYIRRLEPIPFLLSLCGLLPWCPRDAGRVRSFSLWYQFLILVLALLALGSCLHQTVVSWMDSHTSGCPGDDCLRLGLLSDVPLALGAVIGLFSVDLRGFGERLDECLLLLSAYVKKKGLEKQILWTTRWDIVGTLILWITAVVERIRGSGVLSAASDGKLTVLEVFHVSAFVFVSFMLLGLTVCVLHVCCVLMFMVDTYCWEVSVERDLSEAVRKWNVLQAMLRKASGTIEHCFFTIQTAILAAVLLGVADIVQSAGKEEGYIAALIPGALVTLGMVRIFRASGVTAKCGHVASLINSLSFGKDFDFERKYVVEYITHSSAGFYVYEVRLTHALTLKIGYVCVALAFALATKILSDNN